MDMDEITDKRTGKITADPATWSEIKRVSVIDSGNSLWAKNNHLYFTLKSMGLHVKAVMIEGEEGPVIDQIIVAAAPPQVPVLINSTTSTSVFTPLERGEIGEIVGSVADFGDNVVDFPPKR